MVQETVELIRTGNEPADPFCGFREFYLDAVPKLLKHARLLGYRDEQAEDLVQTSMEIALSVWADKLSDMLAGQQFNYVKKVLIRNAWRATKQATMLRGFAPRLWDRADDKIVETDALRELTAVEALYLIDQLPPQQRFVIALRWDGYTISEVADVMEVTPSAVRSPAPGAETTPEGTEPAEGRRPR